MKPKIKKLTLFQSLRESFVPSLRFGTKKASSSLVIARLSRLINKKLYKLGLGAALNRYDNSFTLYSAKKDSELYSDYKKDDIFCNFGSGGFFHKKWENYDYPGQSDYYKVLQGKEGVDFFPIDLCAKNLVLPHADNSVSLIYCSHTLEHLETAASSKFLAECHRILQVGGLIRLAIPSTDNDHKIAAVISSQQSIPLSIKHGFSVQAASHVLADAALLEAEEVHSLMQESEFSAESFFNNAVKNGVSDKFVPSNPERHISYWDYKNILSTSQKLGFSFCIPCYRGTSLAKPFLNLNVFDTTEPHISLYVELVK